MATRGAAPSRLLSAAIIWAIAAGLLLAPGRADAARQGPKRVLILHSFGRDYAPFNTLSATFRTALLRTSPFPVDVYEASLETARFRGQGEDEPFQNYLLALFQNRPLDLIVAVGGPAYEFCRLHRKRLFPATPILIAGMDQRRVSTLRSDEAAVLVQLDLPLILEDILCVLPETKHVSVVMGSSPLEQFWLAEMHREFEPFLRRIAITYLDNLSLEEMMEHVAKLPPHSAIYYGVLMTDAAGIPHEQEQALASLHGVAKAPIFGAFDSEFGNGIVGGHLLSMETVGRLTSQVAIRMLRGEAPASIRMPVVSPGRPVYDWRELKRWGIKKGNFPPGSTVRLQPPSAWTEYRDQILVGIGVFVFQAILITGLVVQHRRRRRAEQETRALNRRLLTAHEDERRRLARELHDDFSQRLARLAIDAAMAGSGGAVREAIGNGRTMREELVRLSEDVHALSYRLHPSVLDDLGLEEALRAECDRFSRQELISAELKDCEIPRELSPEASLCLFRVAQEALRNVSRHARASAVDLSLQTSGPTVRISIHDDGVGFDPALRRGRVSLGLASMRERVHLLAGEFEIRSAPGQGTVILAEIPWNGVTR